MLRRRIITSPRHAKVSPQVFLSKVRSMHIYVMLIHTATLCKIIAWQTDKETERKLSNLIRENSLEAELCFCSERDIQQCIDDKTALIITDYQFWYNNDPSLQLLKFQEVSSAPVIAWTATVNKHIMNAVFSNFKVLFIRNSSSENLMLDTLKKYCGIKHTINNNRSVFKMRI